MIKTEPPAPPAASTALSRRNLFKLGGLAAATASTPTFARSFGTGFTHGVASGEPGPDKVMLWTRFVSDQDVWLEFQVSVTPEFDEMVAGGSAKASAPIKGRRS